MKARMAELGVTCNVCSAKMVGDGSAIGRHFRNSLATERTARGLLQSRAPRAVVCFMSYQPWGRPGTSLLPKKVGA